MTIPELNTQLKSALIKHLKERNHTESGKLANSVVFTCTDNPKLNVKFKSLMYIKFLDDGTFINEFMSLVTTKTIISKYITEKLIKDVQIK